MVIYLITLIKIFEKEGLFDYKTLDRIHDALGREKGSIDLEKGLFNQIYRKMKTEHIHLQ